jgi:DHA1 family bicyclomycin/chloramphenicol resistance-like MFS transporter
MGTLAGLAVGQLAAGPVSDGLRRKRPLLAGLLAFTALSVAWTGTLPFLLGALLSPLAGLGGQGAATTAGIILAALCLGALPCVLLIPRRAPGSPRASRPPAVAKS